MNPFKPWLLALALAAARRLWSAFVGAVSAQMQGGSSGGAPGGGASAAAQSPAEAFADPSQPPPLPPDVAEAIGDTQAESVAELPDLVGDEDLVMGDTLPNGITAYMDLVTANGIDEEADENTYQQMLRFFRYVGGRTLEYSPGQFLPENVMLWAEENIPAAYLPPVDPQTNVRFDNPFEAEDTIKEFLIWEMIHLNLIPEDIVFGSESLPQFGRNRDVFRANYFRRMSLPELQAFHQEALGRRMQDADIVDTINTFEEVTERNFYDPRHFFENELRNPDNLLLTAIDPQLSTDMLGYYHGQIGDLATTVDVYNRWLRSIELNHALATPALYRDVPAFLASTEYGVSDFAVTPQEQADAARLLVIERLTRLNEGEVNPHWEAMPVDVLMLLWHQELQRYQHQVQNLPPNANSGVFDGMDTNATKADLHLLESRYIPPDLTMLWIMLGMLPGLDLLIPLYAGDWVGFLLALVDPTGLAAPVNRADDIIDFTRVSSTIGDAADFHTSDAVFAGSLAPSRVTPNRTISLIGSGFGRRSGTSDDMFKSFGFTHVEIEEYVNTGRLRGMTIEEWQQEWLQNDISPGIIGKMRNLLVEDVNAYLLARNGGFNLIQNPTVSQLRASGYTSRRWEPNRTDGPRPDYLLFEGYDRLSGSLIYRDFDNYFPTSNVAETVTRGVYKKGRTQADGVVLDLSATTVTMQDVLDVLRRDYMLPGYTTLPGETLQEIIFIENGVIIGYWHRNQT